MDDWWISQKIYILFFTFLFFINYLSKNNKFILTNRVCHDIILLKQRKDIIHMYKKTFTHYISKIVVDILFYMSIVCVILVPFTAKIIFSWINYFNPDYLLGFTSIVFLSGLCCVYILFNLKQMYNSLLVGNPFTDKNINHLRKIALSCIIISIIYIIKCFFMFTLATVVIAAVFMVGCLFCLTLKDLFKQAINYKTENELTI